MCIDTKNRNRLTEITARDIIILLKNVLDTKNRSAVMDIKRDYYLQQLIERKENGMIKIITGIINNCIKFSNFLHEFFIIGKLGKRF